MKHKIFIINLIVISFILTGCSGFMAGLKDKKAKRHFEEGIKNFNNENYQGAIISFKKSIDIFPDKGVSHYYLAHSYEEMGNIDIAIHEYQTAMGLETKKPGFYISLADIYAKHDRIDEAIDLYVQSLSLFRENQKKEKINMYLIIGNIYQERRMFDSAIPYYKKAVETNPYNTESYYYLAVAYDSDNQSDEALAACEKAESLFYTKNFAEQKRAGYFEKIYNMLGMKYAKKRLPYKAISKYKKALKINKGYGEAKENMEISEDIGKESDKYVEEAKKMIEKKLFNQAISGLKNALDINSENFRAYYNLGKIRYQLKTVDDSIKNYEKAADLEKEYNTYSDKKFKANLRYGLGTAYFENNLIEKAIIEYMGVVDIDQEYPDIYENIKRAYDKVWEIAGEGE